MGTPGPQKIYRYGIAFKLKAVQMSHQPGVLIKDVAESLCIHPFMLSRWRKEVREGELVGKAAPIDTASVAELPRLREVEQQFKRLRMEHDLLKKSYPVCLGSKAEIFAFIAANRHTYAVQMMCALYGVTRGGFYAWPSRRPCARMSQDEQLTERIRQVHQQSRGYYGRPRVASQLQREGVTIGQRRVARLMRCARLQGRRARRYHRSMVGQRAFFASVPNQQRAQVVQGPNQVWVGDVTYLKVAGQWRYLAVVMDRHSRRVLGWSVSARRDAALTGDALRLSVRKRRPPPGLMFHSDRGIEYAAFEYRHQLARLGISQSMNRPGKMNDNAHMESFFHSMKAEDLHGRRFDDDHQLRQAIRSYIAFYNQQRLHSALRYLPPVAFERQQGLQPCVN